VTRHSSFRRVGVDLLARCRPLRRRPRQDRRVKRVASRRPTGAHRQRAEARFASATSRAGRLSPSQVADQHVARRSAARSVRPAGLPKQEPGSNTGDQRARGKVDPLFANALHCSQDFASETVRGSRLTEFVVGENGVWIALRLKTTTSGVEFVVAAYRRSKSSSSRKEK